MLSHWGLSNPHPLWVGYLKMIALLHKAIQYPEITELLVSTGSATLIEDSPTDYYWGCGADGTGKNRLGQLWMAVRDILKGEGS
jgi:ribA/ribD-fused uncharacterized protein